MTDTPPIYGQGRKPAYPPGHPRRLAIPWLHELDHDVRPAAYPADLDLTGGVSEFPMWGNGPDPTLTITDAEGKGQPVGDCHFAGSANAESIDGNPNGLSANVVVGCYDTYEANSQGVPLGQEQDQGVVMSDALVWQLTHDWHGNVVPVGQGIMAAFVPVAPATAPTVMAKYRKPLLAGVNLTNADQQTFPNWSASPANPPNPQEGHVVLLAKLGAAPADPSHIFGPAHPISWTKVVSADEAWMNACPEEFWMPVSEADREKMGDLAFHNLVALMATLPGFEGERPAPTLPTPPAPVPPVVVTPPPAPPPAPEPPAPPHLPTTTHPTWWQDFKAEWRAWERGFEHWLVANGFTAEEESTAS